MSGVAGKRVIYVLTGCTACGKTDLSLAWARRFGAEIVSGDSLLFYRGMDIGTAKPKREELAAVPHHLIDIVDPWERMDVKRYVTLARAAVEAIEARGRRVLVVGGSGFYLKAFWANVVDDVAVDPALRRDLEARLAAEGLESLVAWLKRLNPDGTGRVDLRNPRRVVRALERCLASGLTLQALEARMATQPGVFSDHTVRIVEIAREPEVLRQRIRRRVEVMLAEGLVDEVRRLMALGFERNPSAAGAIGYREVVEWIRAGESDLEALAERIAANTWKLVRKQRTWFRRQLPPHKVVGLDRTEGEPDIECLFDLPGA